MQHRPQRQPAHKRHADGMLMRCAQRTEQTYDCQQRHDQNGFSHSSKINKLVVINAADRAYSARRKDYIPARSTAACTRGFRS